MNRRGFLKAMLAGMAAPAIVKSENIMKIWTPPEDIITYDPLVTIPDNFGGQDFFFEMWVHPEKAEKWSKVEMHRTNGQVKQFLDGERVPFLPDSMGVKLTPENRNIALQAKKFDGWIQDIRVVKGKAVETRAFEWAPNSDHAIYLEHDVVFKGPAWRTT